MPRYNPRGYKSCFVPCCKSTSVTTPGKVFLTVPHNKRMWKLWIKAARRDEVVLSPGRYCCEDHFNLAEDLENYYEWKMMGGKKRLKKGVVPHIFDCQPDRTAATKVRPASEKRKRLKIIEEALASSISTEKDVPDRKVLKKRKASSSSGVLKSDKEEVLEEIEIFPSVSTLLAVQEELPEEILPSTSAITSDNRESLEGILPFESTLVTVKEELPEEILPSTSAFATDNRELLEGISSSTSTVVAVKEELLEEILPSTSTLVVASAELLKEILPYTSAFVAAENIDKNETSSSSCSQEDAVSVNEENLEVNKFILGDPVVQTDLINWTSNNGVQMRNETPLTLKKALCSNSLEINAPDCSINNPKFSVLSEHFQANLGGETDDQSESLSSEEGENESPSGLIDKDSLKNATVIVTSFHIQNNPEAYIGINDVCFRRGVLDFLNERTELKARDIKLTLMKIKLNDSFARLGDQFGISERSARCIFKKSVKSLAEYLKCLVCWPDTETIRDLLPKNFRNQFCNVQSIIETFEIEIAECPKELEAQVWSDSMRCNTIKYLVSSTLDGFINFVSKGYGGGAADSMLCEQSGFLQVIPKRCSAAVGAESREFSRIAGILSLKHVRLYSPSSRYGRFLLTKDVMERTSRRVREFEMLKPHSVVQKELIPYMDYIVLVAAALINLPSPMIKIMSGKTNDK